MVANQSSKPYVSCYDVKLGTDMTTTEDRNTKDNPLESTHVAIIAVVLSVLVTTTIFFCIFAVAFIARRKRSKSTSL